MTRDHDDPDDGFEAARGEDAGGRDDAARAMPVRRREEPADEWTLRRPVSAEDVPEYADDVYVVDTRGRDTRAGATGAGSDRTQAVATGADERQHTKVMPVVRPADRTSGRGTSGRGAQAAPPPGRVGAPPAAPPPRRRRRRSTGKRIGLGILTVVVLLLVYLVGVPWHAWSTVTKVDTAPTGERPAEGKGWNYLLVGSDSREGMTPEQEAQLGTGDFAGKRTDSIILVHYPASGGKPVLLSFPRDSYVPIPGNGSNKINASYAFGGPQLLGATIEQNTGLRLDGYLEIGFVGFADVVDSLGGVNICVPFDMDDEKAHINLKKGCQDLDGANALGFVRARYSDPRGDVGRAERQRQFLGAIMKGAATPSTVLNPWRYWGFTHSAASGVIVGEDTSLTDVGRVGLAMRGLSNDSALSLVVPLESLNYQTSAGSSVKWDTERAQALFTMLREDQPLTSVPDGADGKPSGG